MQRDHPLRAVAALAAALTIALAAPAAAQGARKPNIVLIVADDLGYNGLGCYGSADLKTPNIDAIARAGVRFTDAYVSSPYCSPSRAGLLTGRYQERFGHELNPPPADEAPPNVGLPLTETTLADRLKADGYATGIVGKWHLGYRPEFTPLRRGFDEFFGFLGGWHDYFRPGSDIDGILAGTRPVQEKEYLTDAFGREARAFIDRHRGDPFFLYLAFNAVHVPKQAPQRYLDRAAAIADPRRRTHAAMLIAMDDAVGAVMAKLRERKLDENTLVIFISDNGGPTPQTTSRNDPLRGHKAQVLEGGIRIPFMMRWTVRLAAGSVYRKPVIALDIFPTALGAAGFSPPAAAALDGVNLLPYLEGKKTGGPHDTLFWRSGRQSALRRGDWKLVRLANQPWRLYDLKTDVGETMDLAAQKPALLKELVAAYDAWDAGLVPPLWGVVTGNHWPVQLAGGGLLAVSLGAWLMTRRARRRSRSLAPGPASPSG